MFKRIDIERSDRLHITDYQKTQHLEWENLFILDGGDNVGTRAIFAGTLAKELFKLLDPGEFADALNVMEMNRVREVQSGDRLMIGTPQGTKAVEIGEDIYKIMDAYITVPQRNNIYRGKLLGNAVTDKQWAEIQNKTYHDMFIGDYWLINDKKWIIGGFEYYKNYNTSEGQSVVTVGHLLMIPGDYIIKPAKMYDTATTANGYLNSLMYVGSNNHESNMLVNHLNPIFGEDRILTFRSIFTSQINENGSSISAVWAEKHLALLTEPMVFGTRNLTNVVDRDHMVNTSCHTQVPLFRMSREHIPVKTGTYWLQDVYSNVAFTTVDWTGSCAKSESNQNLALRPFFFIGIPPSS